jgi:putative tryptophan/tyrosine transport system substrate-binding protein
MSARGDLMMRQLYAVALYAAAALVWMIDGCGQVEAANATGKVARVAIVAPSSASVFTRMSAVLRDRLRELGWVEGQNLIVDQYWGEGHLERLPELMAHALARNPDVLVTSSTPGALAAKKATSSVPIVVAAMGDPVQTGVVSNLARPGGNLTALSTGYTDGFAGKWLELLLEAVPQATKVAVIWNLGNPVVRPYHKDLADGAAARGLRLRFIDVREPGKLDAAFQQAKHAQASVVVCENLFIENLQQVVDLAARYRLPTVYCLSGFARAGGLMSYGTDLQALYRRAAEYIDKVLRGAKVGDLPVEQPTKFELVVNLRTAKELGITIPESILLRADEIIR